jgi:hypothetical protein
VSRLFKTVDNEALDDINMLVEAKAEAGRQLPFVQVPVRTGTTRRLQK